MMVMPLSKRFFGRVTGAILTALAGPGVSPLADELVVSTDLGQEVEISVQVGYRVPQTDFDLLQLGTDSNGEPIYQTHVNADFIPSVVVPLQVGHGFGFYFRVPELAKPDRLSLKVKVKFPRAISTGGQTVRNSKGVISYGHSDSNQEQWLMWSFTDQDPKYHLLGNWKMELFSGERLLQSEVFTVIAADQ